MRIGGERNASTRRDAHASRTPPSKHMAGANETNDETSHESGRPDG